MKTIDITSRLGQFAWRQITPSTIPLPVIFRHNNREEYLCVQMINIHLLSKFSPEIISYCMNQSPIQYYSLTQSEAKLFQYINQFHSNGYLANNHKLDYSRLDLAYITPFIPFLHFYQFISSNSQFIKNNYLSFSSIYNKSITEIENNKCSSNKMISSSPPNVCKSNNSYCRSILFHEKQIMSYSTTSSTDSNQIIVCLSIKDIILTYFPWITPEKFIELCRLKQIIRYRPDKSTHSDLSLRLINIQQFEQYWHFFTQQFSPNPQHVDETSFVNNSPPLTIKTNDSSSLSTSNIIEQSSENVLSSTLSQHQSSPCQMDSIQSIDDQHIQLETNSLLNQIIEIIQQQENSSEEKIDKEPNELIIDSSRNKQEETILATIENKNLRRKRHRSQKCPFLSKRRKRKHSNDQIQWWLNKYAIKPISIILHRVDLPID